MNINEQLQSSLCRVIGHAMLSITFMLVVSLVYISVVSAEPASQDKQKTEAIPIKSDMAQVYHAFVSLQKFLVNRAAFTEISNEKEIQSILETLRGAFRSVGNSTSHLADEPGFKSNLRVMGDLLDDASTRYQEGKKSYAFWRLRTISSNCIACHTRVKVPLSFDGDAIDISGLSKIEQADFYLATRQFEKATPLFLEVASDPKDSSQRMEALRHWLLIYTRVQPNPDEALTTLVRFIAKVPLRAFDQQEVQRWIESLRRWKSESGTIPAQARAENLIRQALGAGDRLSPKVGTVELLRATSLLHNLLDGKETLSSNQRSHFLYLLGLAYTELPYFFVTELPEMFLEQAIYEAPGTESAKEAYGRYEEFVTLGYTGSGGTRIPDEVTLKFKELHDVAFGDMQYKLRGRI